MCSSGTGWRHCSCGRHIGSNVRVRWQCLACIDGTLPAKRAVIWLSLSLPAVGLAHIMLVTNRLALIITHATFDGEIKAFRAYLSVYLSHWLRRFSCSRGRLIKLMSTKNDMAWQEHVENINDCSLHENHDMPLMYAMTYVTWSRSYNGRLANFMYIKIDMIW